MIKYRCMEKNMSKYRKSRVNDAVALELSSILLSLIHI